MIEFNVFDALAYATKKLGGECKISVSNDEIGYKIRLSFIDDGVNNWFSDFTIGRIVLDNSNEVLLVNRKFEETVDGLAMGIEDD